MSELLKYTASFLTGVLLGLVFLQGLWVTVRDIDRSHRPALRLLISLLLRFSVVLAGFFFLTTYAGWQHVLTAVLGFTLLRVYVMRRFWQRQRQYKDSDK